MSRQRKRDRRPFATDGAFAVECPGCRAHLAVARALAGRAAGCPSCHVVFRVPPPELAEPPLPESFERRGKAAPVRAAADVAATVERPQAQPRDHAPPVRAAAAAVTPHGADAPVVFSEPPLPSTRSRPLETELMAETPSPPAGPEPLPAAAGDPDRGLSPTATEPQATAAAASSADPLTFREPVKTVISGGAEIELRRLTPEERRIRRARRNVLILVVGVAMLVALVVILGKGIR